MAAGRQTQAPYDGHVALFGTFPVQRHTAAELVAPAPAPPELPSGADFDPLLLSRASLPPLEYDGVMLSRPGELRAVLARAHRAAGGGHANVTAITLPQFLRTLFAMGVVRSRRAARAKPLAAASAVSTAAAAKAVAANADVALPSAHLRAAAAFGQAHAPTDAIELSAADAAAALAPDDDTVAAAEANEAAPEEDVVGGAAASATAGLETGLGMWLAHLPRLLPMALDARPALVDADDARAIFEFCAQGSAALGLEAFAIAAAHIAFAVARRKDTRWLPLLCAFCGRVVVPHLRRHTVADPFPQLHYATASDTARVLWRHGHALHQTFLRFAERQTPPRDLVDAATAERAARGVRSRSLFSFGDAPPIAAPSTPKRSPKSARVKASPTASKAAPKPRAPSADAGPGPAQQALQEWEAAADLVLTCDGFFQWCEELGAAPRVPHDKLRELFATCADEAQARHTTAAAASAASGLEVAAPPRLGALCFDDALHAFVRVACAATTGPTFAAHITLAARVEHVATTMLAPLCRALFGPAAASLRPIDGDLPVPAVAYAAPSRVPAAGGVLRLYGRHLGALGRGVWIYLSCRLPHVVHLTGLELAALDAEFPDGAGMDDPDPDDGEAWGSVCVPVPPLGHEVEWAASTVAIADASSLPPALDVLPAMGRAEPSPEAVDWTGGPAVKEEKTNRSPAPATAPVTLLVAFETPIAAAVASAPEDLVCTAAVAPIAALCHDLPPVALPASTLALIAEAFLTGTTHTSGFNTTRLYTAGWAQLCATRRLRVGAHNLRALGLLTPTTALPEVSAAAEPPSPQLLDVGGAQSVASFASVPSMQAAAPQAGALVPAAHSGASGPNPIAAALGVFVALAAPQPDDTAAVPSLSFDGFVCAVARIALSHGVPAPELPAAIDDILAPLSDAAPAPALAALRRARQQHRPEDAAPALMTPTTGTAPASPAIAVARPLPVLAPRAPSAMAGALVAAGVPYNPDKPRVEALLRSAANHRRHCDALTGRMERLRTELHRARDREVAAVAASVKLTEYVEKTAAVSDVALEHLAHALPAEERHARDIAAAFRRSLGEAMVGARGVMRAVAHPSDAGLEQLWAASSLRLAPPLGSPVVEVPSPAQSLRGSLRGGPGTDGTASPAVLSPVASGRLKPAPTRRGVGSTRQTPMEPTALTLPGEPVVPPSRAAAQVQALCERYAALAHVHIVLSTPDDRNGAVVDLGDLRVQVAQILTDAEARARELARKREQERAKQVQAKHQEVVEQLAAATEAGADVRTKLAEVEGERDAAVEEAAGLRRQLDEAQWAVREEKEVQQRQSASLQGRLTRTTKQLEIAQAQIGAQIAGGRKGRSVASAAAPEAATVLGSPPGSVPEAPLNMYQHFPEIAFLNAPDDRAALLGPATPRSPRPPAFPSIAVSSASSPPSPAAATPFGSPAKSPVVGPVRGQEGQGTVPARVHFARLDACKAVFEQMHRDAILLGDRLKRSEAARRDLEHTLVAERSRAVAVERRASRAVAVSEAFGERAPSPAASMALHPGDMLRSSSSIGAPSMGSSKGKRRSQSPHAPSLEEAQGHSGSRRPSFRFMRGQSAHASLRQMHALVSALRINLRDIRGVVEKSGRDTGSDCKSLGVAVDRLDRHVRVVTAARDDESFAPSPFAATASGAPSRSGSRRQSKRGSASQGAPIPRRGSRPMSGSRTSSGDGAGSVGTPASASASRRGRGRRSSVTVEDPGPLAALPRRGSLNATPRMTSPTAGDGPPRPGKEPVLISPSSARPSTADHARLTPETHALPLGLPHDARSLLPPTPDPADEAPSDAATAHASPPQHSPSTTDLKASPSSPQASPQASPMAEADGGTDLRSLSGPVAMASLAEASADASRRASLQSTPRPDAAADPGPAPGSVPGPALGDAETPGATFVTESLTAAAGHDEDRGGSGATEAVRGAKEETERATERPGKAVVQREVKSDLKKEIKKEIKKEAKKEATKEVKKEVTKVPWSASKPESPSAAKDSKQDAKVLARHRQDPKPKQEPPKQEAKLRKPGPEAVVAQSAKAVPREPTPGPVAEEPRSAEHRPAPRRPSVAADVVLTLASAPPRQVVLEPPASACAPAGETAQPSPLGPESSSPGDVEAGQEEVRATPPTDLSAPGPEASLSPGTPTSVPRDASTAAPAPLAPTPSAAPVEVSPAPVPATETRRPSPLGHHVSETRPELPLAAGATARRPSRPTQAKAAGHRPITPRGRGGVTVATTTLPPSAPGAVVSALSPIALDHSTAQSVSPTSRPTSRGARHGHSPTPESGRGGAGLLDGPPSGHGGIPASEAASVAITTVLPSSAATHAEEPAHQGALPSYAAHYATAGTTHDPDVLVVMTDDDATPCGSRPGTAGGGAASRRAVPSAPGALCSVSSASSVPPPPPLRAVPDLPHPMSPVVGTPRAVPARAPASAPAGRRTAAERAALLATAQPQHSAASIPSLPRGDAARLHGEAHAPNTPQHPPPSTPRTDDVDDLALIPVHHPAAGPTTDGRRRRSLAAAEALIAAQARRPGTGERALAIPDRDETAARAAMIHEALSAAAAPRARMLNAPGPRHGSRQGHARPASPKAVATGPLQAPTVPRPFALSTAPPRADPPRPRIEMTRLDVLLQQAAAGGQEVELGHTAAAPPGSQHRMAAHRGRTLSMADVAALRVAGDAPPGHPHSSRAPPRPGLSLLATRTAGDPAAAAQERLSKGWAVSPRLNANTASLATARRRAASSK